MGGLPQLVASRVHGGVSAAVEHCQTIPVICLLSHQTAAVPQTFISIFSVFVSVTMTDKGHLRAFFISWMSVRLRGWDKSVGRALEQDARCSADVGVIPRCGNSGMDFFSKSQLNCRFF